MSKGNVQVVAGSCDMCKKSNLIIEYITEYNTLHCICRPCFAKFKKCVNGFFKGKGKLVKHLNDYTTLMDDVADTGEPTNDY